MKQSPQEKARRARRGELFKAGMCLMDCGRPRSKTENLCKPCSDGLVRRYNERQARFKATFAEGK